MKLMLTKIILAITCLLPVFSYAESYEKLPSEFVVTYGDDSAQVQVTYLFSIYCPTCLKFMKDDFPSLKKKYIDSGLVQWNWHPFPNPEKPLTYQAMLCLEMLSAKQKQLFLENCADYLTEGNMHEAVSYFSHLMTFFGIHIPDLSSREFLLKPYARQSAAKFISQDKQINIPSIEVNSQYSGRFPTRSFIEKKIKQSLKNQGELHV